MTRKKMKTVTLAVVAACAACGAGGAMLAMAQQPKPKQPVPFMQHQPKCVGVAVVKPHEATAQITVFRAFEDGTVEFKVVPDVLDEASRPEWMKPSK